MSVEYDAIIERLARALDPVSFSLYEAGGPNKDHDGRACDFARETARAVYVEALATLEELTPAMVAAGATAARHLAALGSQATVGDVIETTKQTYRAVLRAAPRL